MENNMHQPMNKDGIAPASSPIPINTVCPIHLRETEMRHEKELLAAKEEGRRDARIDSIEKTYERSSKEQQSTNSELFSQIKGIAECLSQIKVALEANKVSPDSIDKKILSSQNKVLIEVIRLLLYGGGGALVAKVGPKALSLF
jgi:hypothetical protein